MILNYLNHAKERALERYHLNLTDSDCANIVDIALKDGIRLYQKDSLGRIIRPFKQFPVRINYNGIVMDVVISKKTCTWHLVTFLPKPNDNNLAINSKRRNIVESDIKI